MNLSGLVCTSIIFASLTSFASAFLYDSEFSWFSTPVDTIQWQLHSNFNQSQKDPIKTKSVGFRLYEIEWTLRIDLFQVDASNASDLEATEPVDNPVVLVTSYSLEWPGGENLRETIAPNAKNSSNSTIFCMTEVPVLFPADTVNAFEPGSSCQSAFGRQCTDAIFRRLTLHADGFIHSGFNNSLPAYGGCPEVDFYQDEPCYDVINDFAVPSYNYAKPYPWTTGDSPFTSGDAFLYRISPIYDRGNMTELEGESQRLHVAVFPGKSPAMVCTRFSNRDVDNDGPAASEARRTYEISILAASVVALGILTIGTL